MEIYRCMEIYTCITYTLYYRIFELLDFEILIHVSLCMNPAFGGGAFTNIQYFLCIKEGNVSPLHHVLEDATP